MNLTTQKRIAAALLKCGVTRVRIQSSSEAEEAITREDVRQLIAKGVITTVQKKGTSRALARINLRQKRKGRRSGAGSRKGRLAIGKKDWLKIVRAQRRILVEARGEEGLKEYARLYRRVKAGMFRSKRHLLAHMKERELLPAGARGGRAKAGKGDA